MTGQGCRPARRVRHWPAAIGNGLAAGLCGTAAMTVSSTVEMKVRERPPSTVPARAAGKVLGVKPTGEAEQKRFATFVDWSYGAGWGMMRGVLGAAGFQGPAAAALFFADVWGAELVTLPLLDIGVPPVWRWGTVETVIDAFHHAVYATTTSVVYELLDS